MKPFRKITLKIVIPGAKIMEKKFCAPKGQAWTEQGQLNLLSNQADRLEQHHPDREWRMVQIGPHSFSFIGTDKEAAA